MKILGRKQWVAGGPKNRKKVEKRDFLPIFVENRGKYGRFFGQKNVFFHDFSTLKKCDFSLIFWEGGF